LEDRADNDAALVDAIAGGDREALGTLYDRHGATTWAIARRFGLDEAEADDLVQDVFLEVWSHAADYDPRRASVVTWLAIRTRSRCLDRVRKARRHARILAREGADLEPTSRPPSPLRRVEHVRLAEAVDALADDLREVTRLAYFEGCSTRTIAERLAIPRGTVKSRMRRAREALDDALAGGGT